MLNRLAKLTSDYQRDLSDIERLSCYSKQDYHFVAVGSGPTVFDIDNNVFKNDILNLGQAPQTLHYSELMIEEFKSKFAKNAIIIIIIMCPFFFGNNAAVYKKHYSNRYYYLLSGQRRKQIIGYKRYKNFAADHNMPFLLYGIGLKTLFKIFFKHKKEENKNLESYKQSMMMHVL